MLNLFLQSCVVCSYHIRICPLGMSLPYLYFSRLDEAVKDVVDEIFDYSSLNDLQVLLGPEEEPEGCFRYRSSLH